MSDGVPEAASAPDPGLVGRAHAVFEAWLARQGAGQGESFEALVAQHPELRASLERLRRMDGVLRDAFPSGAFQDPAADSSRAKMLGDYRLLREIGRGGMGIVFEAEQASLRRRVALKILPAQLTLNERALRRFQLEAEITAKLNHRGIIDIHQVGEVAGVHFIAMELIEGTSLDRLIERMRRESFGRRQPKKMDDVLSAHGLDEPASPARDARPSSKAERGSGSKKGSSSASNKNYIETVVKLVCEVADALAHAHQAGVLHRDVKPSNILVRPDGSAVLTDFGLAREQGLPGVSATGDFAGTAQYVSPEQAMSGRVPVDHRTDVFSLGATLYELLTLEPAFPGENAHEVLNRIISKPPLAPQKLNPALAPDLVTIVLKALEKDADRRYQSAAELAEDLRAFIEYRPIRARRTPTILRAWRWVRREPMQAGLLTTLAVGVPLLVVFGRGCLATARELRARGPDLLESELKLGYLQLGLGRYTAAEELFRTAEVRYGTNPEILLGLSLSLLEQERHEEVLALLDGYEDRDGYEERNGASDLSRRLRGDVYRGLNRPLLAEEVETGLEEPSEPEARYLEARRLLRGTLLVRRLQPPALGFEEPHERAAGEDTLLADRKRARAAMQLLDGAIYSSPERAPFHFAQAWAVWVARDAGKARTVAEAIEHLWPGDPVALFYLGVAREVYDATGAVQALDAALERDPGLREAFQLRALVRLQLGEEERALADFEELARVESERAEHQANLAVARLENGDFPGAIEAARRAIELDPEAVTARDVLGNALFRSEKLAEARAAYTLALELDPTRAHLHNDIGLTLYRLGELEEARAHLERAHDLDPGDPLPLYNLAGLHQESGACPRAVELFRQAIELGEERPERNFRIDQAWRGMGVCLRPDDPPGALEAFGEALRIAPEYAGHHLNLGSLLHELGLYEEAVAPLEHAIAAGVGDASAHEGLVDCLEKLKRWGAALAAARAWTDADEERALAWNKVAWLQVDPDGDPALRDVEDAVRSAERAVELSAGEDPEILDTLAWAYGWSGAGERAREEARRAVELARASGRASLAEALESSRRRLESVLGDLETR